MADEATGKGTRRPLAETFGVRASSRSTEFDPRLSTVLNCLMLLAERSDLAPESRTLVLAAKRNVEAVVFTRQLGGSS